MSFTIRQLVGQMIETDRATAMLHAVTPPHLVKAAEDEVRRRHTTTSMSISQAISSVYSDIVSGEWAVE